MIAPVRLTGAGVKLVGVCQSFHRRRTLALRSANAEQSFKSDAANQHSPSEGFGRGREAIRRPWRTWHGTRQVQFAALRTIRGAGVGHAPKSTTPTRQR